MNVVFGALANLTSTAIVEGFKYGKDVFLLFESSVSLHLLFVIMEQVVIGALAVKAILEVVTAILGGVTAIVEGVKYVKDAFQWEYPKPQTEVLLQPVPKPGFVGAGIQAAQTKLQELLNEPNPQTPVIGLYGMAGVGKTSLLRLIHNDCKNKVSSNFDFVIWYTVSQIFNMEGLRDTIAESLSLDLKGSSSSDTGKMKLYSSLENKRFLLILDDVWRPIDLEEVGVNFGHDNSSRVLISSRHKSVVEQMAATHEYCMMVKPLSTEEGWELFRRKAFRNGATAPQNDVEAIARDIAEECQGLPLALNTVAAALAPKQSADEWRRALVLMRNLDPSFPSTHPTIDEHLYQRLRWSYNDLPSNNLKMCFLYCAAFPEDERIEVETLVEMWTGESLVPQKGTSYYMDVGREYIDALVDRCLIQYDESKGYIRVHDVLRDMAIYVGEAEEKCLFLSSQHLQQFPNQEQTTDRKRISLFNTAISHLPNTDLRCPTLASLVLAGNRQLKEIPETFFVNLMSLKVLDLWETAIEALPASVGQLGHLQCLHLRHCHSLKELPDSICNLSHLQFLNLEGCISLRYLPDRIGELQNLKYLNLYGAVINPHQICQLTLLNKLAQHFLSSHAMSLEDLTNLSNLIELNVRVKPEIKGGSMSSWSEMRKLTLFFSSDDVEDDAALDILPQNMQSMKKLQYLCLGDYRGVSLPNCISHFQNLKELRLSRCRKLKELPGMEIGSDAASDGFPMLERLSLWELEIESIVWNEKTMLKLEYLRISGCPVLKTFRTEELPNLRVLNIYNCDELSNVTDIGSLPMLETLTLEGLKKLESIRTEELPNLRQLTISECDELSNVIDIRRLPMLETLTLEGLKKLESIAHWNEKTMLKLEYLEISGCPVLKTFRTEELPNLRELEIQDCDELSNVSDIGSLPMLETLTLRRLKKLESIAHWNEKTMPNLQNLVIMHCPMLKKLLTGLDKLCNLKNIRGQLVWWERIIWEDDNVKNKLSQFFKRMS